MNSKIQKIELNDGHSIPVLGFGTYATEEVIKKGLGIKGLKEWNLSIPVEFWWTPAALLHQIRAVLCRREADWVGSTKVWSCNH